jgi:hypothetical protein
VLPEAVQDSPAGGPVVEYGKVMVVLIESMKAQEEQLAAIAHQRDVIRAGLARLKAGTTNPGTRPNHNAKKGE